MTKARFLRDTLKVLEAEAVKLVEKYGAKVNGNAFKVDSEARAKGYWATDKLASFKNKDGSPAYVQEGTPNWQNILKPTSKLHRNKTKNGRPKSPIRLCILTLKH